MVNFSKMEKLPGSRMPGIAKTQQLLVCQSAVLIIQEICVMTLPMSTLVNLKPVLNHETYAICHKPNLE